MWITALVLGLAGSLHCAGMCSPLAMSVTSLRGPFLMNRLLYNSGRVFTYGLLGALVSAFGQLFSFSAFQNILSLGLGSTLVLLGIGGISGLRIPVVTSAIQKFTSWLKVLFGKFLERKTYSAIAFMGVLNGLLPCGLTYLALTYCLVLQGPLDGFNFMVLFGAGTLPVMLGFTWAIQYLVKRFRLNFNCISTVLLIFLGCLLVGRIFIQPAHHSGINHSMKMEKAEVLCF